MWDVYGVRLGCVLNVKAAMLGLETLAISWIARTNSLRSRLVVVVPLGSNLIRSPRAVVITALGFVISLPYGHVILGSGILLSYSDIGHDPSLLEVLSSPASSWETTPNNAPF